jgi:hypothetical protein
MLRNHDEEIPAGIERAKRRVVTSNDELKDRIEARTHEMMAKLRALKADTRREAREVASASRTSSTKSCGVTSAH